MTSAPTPPDDPLWVSDVPRHGVVRAVVVEGDVAACLDDLNGDGREVELRVFTRDAEGWAWIGRQDDVDVPGIGDSPLFGWAPEIGWAVGRANPGECLDLEWAGERTVVGVNADGWWLAVVSGEPPEDEEPSWPGPRTRPFT